MFDFINKCILSYFFEKVKEQKMIKTKMGRPTEKPKKNVFQIRITDEEEKLLKKCSEILGMTKRDVLIKGLEKVYEEIK